MLAEVEARSEVHRFYRLSRLGPPQGGLALVAGGKVAERPRPKGRGVLAGSFWERLGSAPLPLSLSLPRKGGEDPQTWAVQ
jgi:hypothetical protein